MNKNEIIQIAEMNIDDLRKRKIKRIFTCLGISTAIIAVVAAAKATGIDYNLLNEISTVAMAANSGILGVTVHNVFKAYFAEKISREKLEKYKNGEYPCSVERLNIRENSEIDKPNWELVLFTNPKPLLKELL